MRVQTKDNGLQIDLEEKESKKFTRVLGSILTGTPTSIVKHSTVCRELYYKIKKESETHD